MKAIEDEARRTFPWKQSWPDPQETWTEGYLAGAQRNPWRKWADEPPTDEGRRVVLRDAQNRYVHLLHWVHETRKWHTEDGCETVAAALLGGLWEWMYVPC